MNLEQKLDVPDEPCSLDGVSSQPAGPVIATVCLNNDEDNFNAAGPAPFESGLLYQDLKNSPVQQPAKKVLKTKIHIAAENL